MRKELLTDIAALIDGVRARDALDPTPTDTEAATAYRLLLELKEAYDNLSDGYDDLDAQVDQLSSYL